MPLRGNGGKRQAVALPYPQRGKTGGGKETNGKGNLIVIGSCPPAVRPKGERATYGATKGQRIQGGQLRGLCSKGAAKTVNYLATKLSLYPCFV